MSELTLGPEDPRGDEVLAIAARHLAFAQATTPPADVYALDASALDAPDLTVFGARVDGVLLAIGALRELSPDHGELKSIHTLEQARGRGLGRRLTTYLVEEARRRGYRRVSLETGSQDAFAPSRAVYTKVGFEPTGPFGDYPDNPGSAFMTLRLDNE